MKEINTKIYEEIIPIINKNLNEENLKLFLYWIIQRYNIHILKDIKKEPFPWTKDEILKTYSFTNVRRIQDKVTKFVLSQICLNGNLTLKEKIINLLLFRIYNNPSSYELLNLPIKQNIIQTQNFYEFLEYHTKYLPQDVILYRPAYMCNGTVKAYDQFSKNIPSKLRPFYMVWKAHKQNVVQNIEKNINQDKRKQVFNLILGINGLGEFLAYQIYVDLTYCPQTKLTENDFVYLGQGALQGVNLVCPKIPRTKRYMFIYFTAQNLNIWLKKYYNTDLQEIMYDLPENMRYLSLSNIQNCLCEFSKYYKFKYSDKPFKKRYYIQKNNLQ